MKAFLAAVLNRKFRLWAYGVCLAVSAFLGVKGILDSTELLYLNFIFAAFFGVAIANVPTKDAADPPATSPADRLS
jgi:hypothetical protein